MKAAETERSIKHDLKSLQLVVQCFESVAEKPGPPIELAWEPSGENEIKITWPEAPAAKNNLLHHYRRLKTMAIQTRVIEYLAKFAGGVNIPTGAVTGKRLTTDGGGNAAWGGITNPIFDPSFEYDVVWAPRRQLLGHCLFRRK